MQRPTRGLLMLLLLALTPLYAAATATAVSGTQGYLAVIAGKNKPVVTGPALATPIGSYGVAVDSSGNTYIADPSNGVIEKVTPSGTLSIIAGKVEQKGLPTAGPATSSDLAGPLGVAVDSAGNVYIADTYNQVIEKVTPSGTLSIIAGVAGHSGSPTAGPATSSDLNFPLGVAVDSAGNVYIADTYNQVIEKVTPSGTLSIIAGKVEQVGLPTAGPATSSELNYPQGVAVDSAGNVYIADTDNDVIEKVTKTTGALSIIAGMANQGGTPTAGPATSSDLYSPEGVAVDSAGNVYIADTYNQVIEKVTSAGTLSIVAGTGNGGTPTPGPATGSALYSPWGVAVSSAGKLLIADSGNGVVEAVASGTLSIVAGIVYVGTPTPGPATSSDLNNPTDVATDSSGDVYIADTGNNVIDKVSPAGTLSIVAGTAGVGGEPTPGPATSSHLDDPNGVVVDGAGNLYIADSANDVIEKVTPSGALSIIAGVPGHRGAPTPGPATSSDLNVPSGITVDSAGNVYIADTDNHVIEKVTPSGTLSIIAGVAGDYGPPTPGPATSSHFEYPQGLAVDAAGNVYIADTDNDVIEKVTTSGTLSIIAGIADDDAPPTPGPATSSHLEYPAGVTVDAAGNLFIADADNNMVEKVTSAGTLSIVAGGLNLDGPPSPGPATSSPLNDPTGVAVDSAGNLYIADSGNADLDEVFGVAYSIPAPAAPPSSGSSTTTSTTLTPTVKTGTASVTRGRISGRSVSDTVSCSGAGACTVAETLKAMETYKVGRKHKTTKHRTVTVGSDTVNVNGGLSLSVKVPLNGTGNALLREHGKLRATLTVTQGTQILRVQTITYTKPKTKPKSKSK